MVAPQVTDAYGTEKAARESLVKALIAERRFWDLPAEKRDAFIEWAFANGGEYKDGDKIDWIGAFYDWIEK